MNDDHHDSFSFAAIHVCDVVAAAISGEMTLNVVAKKYYTVAKPGITMLNGHTALFPSNRISNFGAKLVIHEY